MLLDSVHILIHFLVGTHLQSVGHNQMDASCQLFSHISFQISTVGLLITPCGPNDALSCMMQVTSLQLQAETVDISEARSKVRERYVRLVNGITHVAAFIVSAF
jgi:hypothetical protein